MGGKAWTQEEERKVMELKKQGFTYKKIGGLLGRTPDGIRGKYHLIKKHGFTKFEAKGNGGWTRAEEKKLIELKEKGWKNKDIAKILNRNNGALEAKWQKLTEYKKVIDTKPDECPVCGNRHVGETVTYVITATRGYFCRNCLTEWTDKGILKPAKV